MLKLLFFSLAQLKHAILFIKMRDERRYCLKNETLFSKLIVNNNNSPLLPSSCDSRKLPTCGKQCAFSGPHYSLNLKPNNTELIQQTFVNFPRQEKHLASHIASLNVSSEWDKINNNSPHLDSVRTVPSGSRSPRPSESSSPGKETHRQTHSGSGSDSGYTWCSKTTDKKQQSSNGRVASQRSGVRAELGWLIQNLQSSTERKGQGDGSYDGELWGSSEPFGART